MSEKNKEVVEKVNAAFAEGSVEGFLTHCSEDIVWTMIGEEKRSGKKVIRDWMSSMEGQEPPKFTVDNLLADGDLVVANGDMTMKDKDGKIEPYSYCDIYRFSDANITELTSYVVKTQLKTEGERTAAA